MEEYWQLNWSRRQHRTDEQLSQLFNHDAATDQMDIWNLTLNDIDPKILSRTDQDLPMDNRPFIDPRTGKVIQKLEIDWTNVKEQLQLFKAFPAPSTIFRSVHKNGLEVMTFVTKAVLSESDRMLITDYNRKKPRIAMERATFHEFVKIYTDTRLGERFANPSEEVAAVGKMSIISANPTKYEDCTYSIQTGVQLEDPKNEFIRDSFFELGEELKAIGLSQKILIFSDQPMKYALPKKVEMAQQFLRKDPEFTRTYNEYIGGMGRKSGGIYLNSDTIYQILSAEGTSSWTVPFLVQNSDSVDSFLYFESPCQKAACLSALELERIGLKICFHSGLLRSPYSFEEERFLEKPAKSVSIKTKKDSDSDQDDDDDEDSRLVIIDPEDSEVQETPKEAEEEPPKVTEEYKVFKIDEYLSKYASKGHLQPHNYLINKVELKLLANPEPLSLIVTNSCDGLYKGEPVALSFKLEYKSEFGAQKMGLDELLREWCAIAFSSRINHVVRVRVDYTTSLCMSLSYLNQEEIESELLRLYDLKPERLLTRLFNVLNLVTRFPVGKYLLDKEVNNSQILVYMETERSDCGKLWKDIMAAPKEVSHTRPSFVEHSIDDHVVTQLHRINCTIPGCIPPLSYDQEKRQEIDRIAQENKLIAGNNKNYKTYKKGPYKKGYKGKGKGQPYKSNTRTRSSPRANVGSVKKRPEKAP